jgi:hypothetical protein
MSVGALAAVPAGTKVRLSIRLPNQPAGAGDSFVWTAPRRLSAEEARREIERDLVKTFVETFLPVE